MTTTVADREMVVVIHGFGGKRLWMLPLTILLRRRYKVVNWSYFSLAGSIEEHAQQFHRYLQNINHDGPINIVAHSMGSIVTRAALQMGEIENLKRVVMLAPPNSGSHVAKYATYFLGSMCRPIAQLSSDESSYVNGLPKSLACETGVIAAKYDVLVPAGNTAMPGLADHATLAATHNSLLCSRKVARMIERFLTNGSFAE